MVERAQIEAVFEAALALEAGSRADFVEAACAGDERKRRAVLALLAAHAREDGVLEGSVSFAPVAAVPDRIGVYGVLREIGRGGMGSVYEAERDDGQFRKRVAIKLLRDRDDAELRDRVLAERQILAALDHQNIARLFDGGVTEDGRPYLVMEHVTGLPVDVYCDRLRLTVPERLRLFCVIARAVEHAHRNLVVHRDLKPSNILVTPDGEVKLLDFGVAKLLNPWLAGSAPLTRDRRALTPEYASPEQLLGEPLSTVSDVYSLGVVLYELLTGRRPHAAQETSPAALAQAACRGVVERASARVRQVELVARAGREETLEPRAIAAARQTTPERLSRALAGDLDAILAMALRPEPARRYGSAELLAQDIERHLAERRVHAHDGSRGYALRKFVRRHRVQLAALAVAGAALAVGTGAALWQARAARAERDRAAQAHAEAQQVTEFLLQLFDAATPEAGVSEAVTARELVARGVQRIETLQDQPAVQASLLAALGQVLGKLAEYEDAERLTVQALARYGEQRDAAGTARMLLQQGSLQRERGAYREAEQTLLRAAALQQRQPGARHSDVGATYHQLAQIAVYLGNFEAAQARADTAYALQRAARGELDRLTLSSLALRGVVQRRRGVLDSAEQTLRRVVALRPQTPSSTRAEALDDQLQLADVLLAQADTAEAERLLRDVLALARRTPDELDARARVRTRLAGVHSKRGEFSAAERLLRELYDERVAIYPPGHRAIAESALGLAGVLLLSGDLDGAEPLHRIAVESYRTAVGEHHLAYGNALAQLAATHLQRGQLATADSLLTHAIALRTEAEGSMAHGLPDLLRRRAQVKIAQRDYSRAESLLQEALRNATVRRYSPGVRREVHETFIELYEAWRRPALADRHRDLARNL